MPVSGIFPTRHCAASSGATTFMHRVTSWDSFEPWLSRIENFPESSLWPLAEEIPPEWYSGASDELERLLTRLLARRSRVRELILGFQEFIPQPLPELARGGELRKQQLATGN